MNINGASNSTFQRSTPRTKNAAATRLEQRAQELAEAERRLEASWRRLRKAEEVSHLGSWEMDIPNGDSRWSDEFYRICGLEPGAVPATAEEGFKLIHPDDRERAAAEVSRAIETCGYYSIEKRIVRPNSEVRYVQSVGEILTNEEGQAERLMGSFLDITERKLSEEALRQSLLEVESSNAELDAYAATVAHDLRNPIGIIIGFSTLLEERADELSPEDIAKSITSINQTSQKMARIIEELLLLASVRKQAQIHLTPLNMPAILNDVLTLRLKKLIDDSQATIEITNNWPTVLSYGPWIEEVWANYISNAIKYGGTPPQIEIGADEGAESVRFWVRDNGAGLTLEQQGKLFAEFSRVNVENPDGNGLGLSIVQRIMDKLGGSVGVNSEVGTGSMFYFTLPRK